MGRKPLDTDTCPFKRELRAYADQRLVGEPNERIYLHLKHCERCLDRLAGLTRRASERVPSPDDIIAGRRSRSLWARIRERFRP